MDIEIEPIAPRSICRCGHTGDSLNSQHSDIPSLDPEMDAEQNLLHAVAATGLEPGHGECLDDECPCTQFEWMCDASIIF